jgi:ATP-dependent Lhr-like helicase
MPLSAFHPAVTRWFEGRFAAPTPAQARGWKAIRSGRPTLIAAPTGSGKTLAAFLNALDELLTDGVERGGELPDETRVLYVSPLKALSADIHHNLAEPRREIRTLAAELGYPEVRITAAVRSGDTPQSERQAMLRVVAEEGVEGAHGRDRGRGEGTGATDRPGRCEGVCRRRSLVRLEARDPGQGPPEALTGR